MVEDLVDGWACGNIMKNREISNVAASVSTYLVSYYEVSTQMYMYDLRFAVVVPAGSHVWFDVSMTEQRLWNLSPAGTTCQDSPQRFSALSSSVLII